MKRWLINAFNTHSKTQLLLLGILLISVSLRIAAAFLIGDQVEELPGTYDQISYHNLALRVLGGYGFSFGQTWWPITPAGEPTAHWSFLYTIYLVVVYGVFGPHPLIARVIQAVLVGILHPYLVFLLGKKVFNVEIGVWAAFITAIYAYFVYYAATLMTEPFYITAILGGFLISLALLDRSPALREGKTGLLWGAVLGMTILLRQLYLLFVPVLLLWVGWVSYLKNRRVPVLAFGVALLTIAGTILPFTAYNYARFHRFVLLNTNSGYAFFWGNHPIYGDRFVPILTPEMGTYQDLIPAEVRHLDEAALDQELLRRGIQFVLADPVRYIRLSFSRIPAYFMFWPSAGSGTISNVSRVASFGLFLPFMVLGFIRSLYLSFTRKKSLLYFLQSPEGLLGLFVLFYSGIHILTWALIRYRLPVDAVLILYAGYGLSFVMRWVTRRLISGTLVEV